MNLEEVIMHVAGEKKIITRALHTIPDLTGMTTKIADHLLFELAEVSRGKHTYDPELVRMCCQYLFRKAAECVMKWGESTDGHVELDAGITEVVSNDIPSHASPAMRTAFQNAQDYGDALYNCHLDYIEAQTHYSGEQFMVELCLLFRWCMSLGISCAIESKLHGRIPRGQKIESIIPTQDTFAWMRSFMPR